MAWRLAESLKKLREQINSAYPNRDRSSDGSIGDAKHSSRKSDHNPNQAGVVCAVDIDEDLSPSNTVAGIVAQIQMSRDDRVNYIIYEGQITVKGDITRWKKYTGVNPHKHHAHISVKQDARFYDNTRQWQIAGAIPPDPSTSITAPVTINVAAGDSLWGIASKHRTSVAEIKRLNGLTSDTIHTGQTLIIR